MLPAQRSPAIVYQDDPGTFLDQITFNGSTVDMTGATVLFFMRSLASRYPVLDGNDAAPIAPADQYGNNVGYAWQVPTDVAVEGEFFGWWRYTLPGSESLETPEFPILITDHGPGLATQTGPIVDGISVVMPITFNALRNDVRFGDRWLQQAANMAQWRIFGSVSPPDIEADTYHPLVLDYLSKRVALALIKPGVDYWSRQQKTVTTTQTSEVASYPDMIASLRELGRGLRHELTQEWRDIQALVPGLPQRHVMPYPTTSLACQGQSYVTRDPSEMPPLLTGWFGLQLEFSNWPP